MTLKKLAGALIAVRLGAAALDVHAQVSGDKAKIDYITDLPGLYADIDGQDDAEAVKMAIEDTGGKVFGKPIELVTADHQNEIDTVASKACEWIDQQGLDMLLGGTNSAMSLAMNKVASEKKRVFIDIGVGMACLTNEECMSYTIHHTHDTVVLAKGMGSVVVKQGGKSWSSLIVDYAFDHSLENDTTAVMRANGDTAVGSVRHPLSASDSLSYLLQAQSLKAQILGLANADGDTINSIEAAKEFGITKTMRIAGLLMFINDVHNLGLQVAEGLLMTDSWYWDMNDASCRFVNRYLMKTKKMPSSLQAADYSAVPNYIKAVAAAGTDDPDKVIAQLEKTKIGDFCTKGYTRQDGCAIHDMYLLQVKTSAESKKLWDYLKVVATIPDEQVFITSAESKCLLMKKQKRR